VNDDALSACLLRNARIVLPNRIAESTSLLIENGHIARIVENRADQSIQADSVIDLTRLTLFPGFIDIHIHGSVGVDTMAASGDDLRRVGTFLAPNGVTSWLPTLVPAPAEQYQRAIGAISELMNDHAGLHSRPLGVHYEGPFVNIEQCGALHREYFRKFTTAADFNTLPTIQRDGAIHMMTLAPEIEGGIELIKELKQRNWIVSIGHTRAVADILGQALAAGAHHMTHFMNAMTPLHHRKLGAVGWGLIHDDVCCDVIADGIHVDRSILRLVVRNKTPNKVSLISDAIAAAGMGDGDYEIWGEKIAVKKGRTQNTRGSIAGSVITMLDAVRMMVSLGFSECEVARMASSNPARLLGIDQDCGSIEEGKRADLVALDDDQNVRLTMISGRIAFQS
jgi:N-acetylglucosamine-6-phosphate deacetylase